jgi:anti-anti-sigma factor
LARHPNVVFRDIFRQLEKISLFFSNFPAILYSPVRCSLAIVQVIEMEIHHEISRGIVIVTFSGWLDTTSAGKFLEYCVLLPPATPIIFDLSGLSFLSRTGLRALLRFRNMRASTGSVVVIAGSRGFVDTALKMNRFNRLFPMYPSVADAIPAIATAAAPIPRVWGGA